MLLQFDAVLLDSGPFLHKKSLLADVSVHDVEQVTIMLHEYFFSIPMQFLPQFLCAPAYFNVFFQPHVAPVAHGRNRAGPSIAILLHWESMKDVMSKLLWFTSDWFLEEIPIPTEKSRAECQVSRPKH